MTQKSSSPSLAVGLLSSAVPFLRRSGDVNVCWSEGRSSVSSLPSVQSELIQRVGPIKYSARYSRAELLRRGSAVFFVFFLFYQPFILGKSTEQGCSFSVVPSVPFIQTKHSRLLLCTEQLHWSTNGAARKVFPALSEGKLIDIDDSTVTSPCPGVSGFQKWFSDSDWSLKVLPIVLFEI